MKQLLAAVGTALFLTAGQVSANLLFSLDSATLSDGGTLTGTFTTNDAVTSLLDYDLTTSGGALTGFEYTPATAPGNFSSLPSIIVVETLALDHLLQITFTPPLTAAGSSILVGQFDSFEQVDSVHREVTAGSAVPGTPAPEPSTIAILAIGLLGLIGVRRRQS